MEIETQKEREKNRSQILLLQIREKRMKNQNHSSTPATKILSPQSNKKNQKTRKYNYDGESVNSETVKITPRQTPRKSPKSKGVVSTFEVGMMNRGTYFLHVFVLRFILPFHLMQLNYLFYEKLCTKILM